MSRRKLSLTTVLALLSIASAVSISEECLVENNKVACKCVNDTEFHLPSEYSYANATSLSISSCKTASLRFPDLSKAKSIDQLIIRDISEELIFDILLGTTKISYLELRNIKKIKQFSRGNFESVKYIGRLEIRNVFIEYFEEEFAKTKVVDLAMVNVTIARLEDFSFTEWGRNLMIIDSKFRKIAAPLNFYFSNVHIANSTFEMEKSKRIAIESDYALIEDNVFFNVTMNVLAKNSIRINGTCLDGMSSLTLISNNTKSHDLDPDIGEKLAKAGIAYHPKKYNDKLTISSLDGNVFCVVGPCECPKSTGQNANRPVTGIFILQIVTLLIYLLPFR